jgi:hypothetical protein
MKGKSMKRFIAFLLGAALLITTGMALMQSSSSYDLSRHVIAGGGQSSSSSYTLQGTAGQALAGPPASASSRFELESGFWAGFSGVLSDPASQDLYLPVVRQP